jgi:hypothetical protein
MLLWVLWDDDWAAVVCWCLRVVFAAGGGAAGFASVVMQYVSVWQWW